METVKKTIFLLDHLICNYILSCKSYQHQFCPKGELLDLLSKSIFPQKPLGFNLLYRIVTPMFIDLISICVCPCCLVSKLDLA